MIRLRASGVRALPAVGAVERDPRHAAVDAVEDLFVERGLGHGPTLVTLGQGDREHGITTGIDVEADVAHVGVALDLHAAEGGHGGPGRGAHGVVVDEGVPVALDPEDLATEGDRLLRSTPP